MNLGVPLGIGGLSPPAFVGCRVGKGGLVVRVGVSGILGLVGESGGPRV